MSFKDCLDSDLDDVFFNDTEFATEDAQVIAGGDPVTAIYDWNEELEEESGNFFRAATLWLKDKEKKLEICDAVEITENGATYHTTVRRIIFSDTHVTQYLLQSREAHKHAN